MRFAEFFNRIDQKGLFAYLLLANPSIPASSVRELITLSKKGAQLNYSSPGVGNTLHFAGDLFNLRAGTTIFHVPYKGVAPARKLE